MINRRQVIFVGGYDPQGVDGFYGLFKSALRRTQRSWQVKAELGPAEIDSDSFAHWTVDLGGANWQTATRFDFLRQEQVIRSNIAQPMSRQLPRALTWTFGGLFGSMPRIWRASWRFAVHLIYFQVLLLIWIALAVAAGCIAGIVLARFAGLPTIADVIIGIVVALGLFGLLRPLFNRWHVIQITNHWPILRQFARGAATCFDALIDAGAERLISAARADAADEIVVLGHSGGGVLASAIVADALAREPALAQHRAKIVLLTLGSIMPAVALFTHAKRMREIVRRLATEPSIIWVDCQSRKDVMNFWNFDPVDGVGIDAGAARCNPLVWQVRFKEMVSADYYKRLRRNFFRLHYQFILGGDRRAAYDYVMLTCGPLPIATWAAVPEQALASFAPDGALNQETAGAT